MNFVVILINEHIDTCPGSWYHKTPGGDTLRIQCTQGHEASCPYSFLIYINPKSSNIGTGGQVLSFERIPVTGSSRKRGMCSHYIDKIVKKPRMKNYV